MDIAAPTGSAGFVPAGSGNRLVQVCCLLATAIVAATLAVFSGKVLQDPDNWWHIRVGLDILATGTVPTVDTYSHTFAGQPWIAKEWLGQVLLALAYRAGGWNGVVLLTISAVCLATYLLAQRLGRAFRPTLALGLTVLSAFLAASAFNARPFVFSLPILVVWTGQLFDAARDERPPSLWLLALLCLWANLHASFTLGFVIAFLAGLDVLARTGLARPRLLAQWLGFGLLCPLATLINPYGVEAILATFTVAYGNEAVALIDEWQSFSITEYPAQGAVLGASMVGVLVWRVRMSWGSAGLALFTLCLLIEHGRFAYLFFLLMPLVVAAEIAKQYPALSATGWAAQQGDGLEAFVVRRFGAVRAAIAALLAVVAAMVACDSALGPSPKTSAAGALAFAAEQGISGNVLNSYSLGGTLIFHGLKTFIDGRTDQLFLGGFMTRDDESERSSEVLRGQLETHAIDWALLAADDPRIALFEAMPDWRRAYADDDARIYLPRD